MRVVIAGGGQVATLIARRLGREGNEVVVVEEKTERCAQLQEQLDAQIVQGNARSDVAANRAERSPNVHRRDELR